MAMIPVTNSTDPPIKVLLIDDQPTVGEAVRRMLASEEGLDFYYCCDPAQALPQAIAIAPTVILQDLVMPEIDGLLLLKFLRAHPATRQIPMIVLSAQEEASLKAEAFAAGANDYLVKLPDPIELIARIRYHSRAYTTLLERDAAYLALQESEQRLQNVLENMPVMMMAFDHDRQIVVWNRECEKVTGYSAAEIINNPQAWQRLQGTTVSFPSTNPSFTAPQSTDWEIVGKDGQIKNIAWSNISDRFPIPQWAGWGIGVDITQRKQAEIALERESRQLREIIQNAPIAIAMFDRKMHYLAYSNQWVRDYQLEGESLLGKSHYEVFLDLKLEWQDYYQRALAGEYISHAEDRWTRANGTVLYSRWAMQPWYTPERQIGGIIVVIVRIDELVKARETALEAAQTKAQFLANMSHEIRTPMNGVLGMAGILQQTPLATKQQEYVNTILKSAKHLLNIINDILDFSKLEAGEMPLESISFDLYQLGHETLELMRNQAEEKGLTIQFNWHSETPQYVQGDPNRIRQVLLNLIGNSIKFTNQGGIKVQVQLASQTDSIAQVCFAVIDSGIGIPESALNKLFQSFSQVDASTSREYGGTGLGLAICKQLVSLMNGEIGVESEVEKGSKFWFILPLDVQHQLVTPRNSDSESEQKQIDFKANLPQSLKILVAEDNAINQAVILNQLQILGYQADAVINGIEVLEATHQKDYDLIFMDCQMPLMDGYQTTQELRQRQQNHPHQTPPIVVALTANAMAADREKCLAYGMNDYLSKPMELRDLVTIIRRWFSAPSRPETPIIPLPDSNLSNSINSTPSPTHSPLNLQRLETVSLGKTAVFRKLLELFRDNSPQDLDQLAQAVASEDLNQIAYYAHRLKGSAANLGAEKLAELAGQLEKMAHAQKLSAALEIVHHCQVEMTEIKEFIDWKLAQLRESPSI